MKIVRTAMLLLCTAATLSYAGDQISGPISYSVDLSRPFTTYMMSPKDKQWCRSLVRNLHYNGKVVHFVKTSLPLMVRNSPVQGAVYQAVEEPETFYVVDSDAILKIGAEWPYNPGVGGFSMHAPRSRNFIVCLNLGGGVPFAPSSAVRKGIVTWTGHDWNRFKRGAKPDAAQSFGRT